MLQHSLAHSEGSEEQRHHLHESPSPITIPLIILAALSAIGGFVNIPEVFGGEEQLSKFLSPVVPGAEQGHLLSRNTNIV
jgi:NADH-quinone oxidoreductase subunit L